MKIWGMALGTALLVQALSSGEPSIRVQPPLPMCPGVNSIILKPRSQQGHIEVTVDQKSISENGVRSDFRWSKQEWLPFSLHALVPGVHTVAIAENGKSILSIELKVLPSERVDSKTLPELKSALEQSTLPIAARFHPTTKLYVESVVCTAPQQLLAFVRSYPPRVEDVATYRQFDGRWILVGYGLMERE